MHIIHDAIAIVIVGRFPISFFRVGPNVVNQVRMIDVNTCVKNGDDWTFLVDDRFVPQLMDVLLFDTILIRVIQRIVTWIWTNHAFRCLDRNGNFSHLLLFCLQIALRYFHRHISSDIGIIVWFCIFHFWQFLQTLDHLHCGIERLDSCLHPKYLVQIALLHYLTIGSCFSAQLTLGLRRCCREKFFHVVNFKVTQNLIHSVDVGSTKPRLGILLHLDAAFILEFYDCLSWDKSMYLSLVHFVYFVLIIIADL